MQGDQRPRVLALLRRHGWNATSFQILEEGFHYYFDGDGDGHTPGQVGDACVAYADTGRAWVVAGSPVAEAGRLAEVAARFVAAAAAQGRRVVFFATEARFIERVTGGPGGVAPQRSAPLPLQVQLIGEQPVWDPTRWSETVERSAGVREQLRRAQRKGVGVRRLAAAEVMDARSPVRVQIDRLVARWLAARPLAPMSFLVAIQPFSFAEERRFFVAERAGEVVGFLAAVPVYARGGWLFEDLLRHPTAPNGTTELLIDAGMRAAASEGSRYVTLGLAPLAGPVHGVLAVVRRVAAALYDFGGVQAFRAKLRPDHWDPIYLANPLPLPSPRRFGRRRRSGGLSGTRAVIDTLVAFAGGRLTGFGVETMLRGPAFVVRLLAALLIPWTALLALLPARLFPGAAVKWAWVGFDVLLAGALFALAARWRRWLGVALAVAVTADALVTAAQVAIFDLPRVSGPGALVTMLVAVVAPSLAAVILWNAIDHRRGDGAAVVDG